MNERQIARDFGVKIRDRMQEQLQRELDLLVHMGVLQHVIIDMLIELGAGITNAVGLIGIQMRRESASLDEVYDLALAQIQERGRGLRAESLEKLAAIRGEPV